MPINAKHHMWYTGLFLKPLPCQSVQYQSFIDNMPSETIRCIVLFPTAQCAGNGCPLFNETDFELVYLPYIFTDLHQIFNTDTLGLWVPHAIRWTMGISPLWFAERTCRLTPLIIVGGTSGAIFFRAIDIIRFSCASEDATDPPRYTSCFRMPQKSLIGRSYETFGGVSSPFRMARPASSRNWAVSRA